MKKNLSILCWSVTTRLHYGNPFRYPITTMFLHQLTHIASKTTKTYAIKQSN
ncbi:Uncharacterized protein APZ42_010074 [Daphnia magna]|uniref:Uncharacterized protein n=1 Tax=Daphnia magna TaxID=35525 RepID=A0A164DKY6_9CRUS|nr:Uncharacterized protein APZ42_010074 [Daphnia magna]